SRSGRSTDRRERASASSSARDSRQSPVPSYQRNLELATGSWELAIGSSFGGSLSGIALKDLLEAGVHFGHQTKRWNPKMKAYIFGERNGIYIIDLAKTAKLFREAEQFATNLAAEGKTVLFVGTKRQAQDAIAEEAQRSQMFFVNQRWLGGVLTNFSPTPHSPPPPRGFRRAG